MTECSTTGPYQFTQKDLAPELLDMGVRATLQDFYAWRDANPGLVAAHVDSHTEQLHDIVANHQTGAQLRRHLSPAAREEFRATQLTRKVGFFCLYNAAEIPDTETVELFEQSMGRRTLDFTKARRSMVTPGGAPTLREVIGSQIPSLRDEPELTWLDEQLARLYRILPEAVIRDGGMGKTVRTTIGVLALGVYDTLHDTRDAQRNHLKQILPACYAFGAMYPIIDDTLQDTDYVSERDKSRYHQTILDSLQTGEPVDSSVLPDHPLAEELERLHAMLLDAFPFDTTRHLYSAGESMYLAQDRDAGLRPESVAVSGLRAIYPDIFVKSSMTRIIANIIGRRELPDEYYARAVNINFANQFRDDLQDRHEDKRNGHVTPFTLSPEGLDTNPLRDLFAYSAYIAEKVFGGDPVAADILTYSGAKRLAAHFHADQNGGRQLINDYGATAEIANFIQQAIQLPKHTVRRLQRSDVRLQKAVDAASKDRSPTAVDPRTFVSDNLPYLNQVIQAPSSQNGSPLDKVIDHALQAGGKRLRPALTLMLAESLGVDRRTVEPIFKAVEYFHTASLIFDDLPAQDNATLRRGQPTAHIAFGEATAQLAGIAMMSTGFTMLSKLARDYPADKVTDITSYFGNILGPERLCLGQDMDLSMAAGGTYTTEQIIEMYNLKTSTLIEAALLPVMVLTDRPAKEIEHIKNFAYHAGIVYQIRDDILDATATADTLGKDAGNDVDKINIVRNEGFAEAQRRMEEHLGLAQQSCNKLPFDTTLLEQIVLRFSSRKA